MAFTALALQPAATQTAAQRAHALVARMTTAEKLSQLRNAASAIPRLGIPAYDWWNEGLHGAARGGVATVFPQAIGLAASFDPSLLQAVGTVTGRQSRARYDAIAASGDHPRYHGLTVWSPNINIFRDPRWGRGQETYGEDPVLTAALARGFISGLQGPDPDHPVVIATPKHFAVHSGPERGRHGFDATPSPHDLEDTYLPAFRAAIVDARAGSVMCAYNAINGTPACANRWLLDERLRKDWGFKGYVVSDCDAIDDITQFHHYRASNQGSAAAALRAGTDLNCGDAYAWLTAAVKAGDVSGSDVDAAVERLFTARFRLGMFDHPGKPAIADAGPTAADRGLALRAAAESIVLLKNEASTLPLKAGTTIAVIGPDADALSILEANYHGTARQPVTPLAGLRARFGAGHVRYAQGSMLAPGVGVPVPGTALADPSGVPGLRAEYFASPDLSGRPTATRTDRTVDLDVDHAPPLTGLPGIGYSVRWTGRLKPPGPGDYTLAVRLDRCFDCARHDAARLYVDDRLVASTNDSSAVASTTWHAADTRDHAIRLEWTNAGHDQGIRLAWTAPAQAQLDEARRAMRDVDVDAVVAVVGLSPDLEGEELDVDVPGFAGGDRTDLALPAPQQRLLDAAADSGKPLVVVLTSGSAVALDWAKAHASAIVLAWYPGEAGGTAIARAIAGDDNPAGRLPVTFYSGTDPLPPFTSYAMAGRTYRYFTGKPVYAFGDGIGYSTFTYGAAQAATRSLAAGQNLQVDVPVTNSGNRDGDDVVQAYLASPDAADAPRRKLAAFQRIHLAAGQSRTVHLAIDARELSLVDALGNRAVRPGRYQLFVGGTQPREGQVPLEFTITGTQRLPH